MREEAVRKVRVVPRISEIPGAAWDACAAPDAGRLNPFVLHAFLKALEDGAAVGERSGWIPQHLVLEGAAGTVEAVAPAYLKRHSQGEYVFDHGWAEAYQRAGGRYYPKLQIAVPFTPVPGPRFMVPDCRDGDERQKLLAAAAIEIARQQGLSSVHATFVDEATWSALASHGYLQRTDQQFHWSNAGYGSFDDFLAALASRKRKTIRKERETVRAAGLVIEPISGSDITETHWDAFFAFYMDTGSRKWGRPYLTRTFFSLLGQAMAERCLLVMVRRNGSYIAGALNLIGGDCLYGRYWGAIEQHPCLHFEVCYYQAIEYAITHKLTRVEAGAQGEHKLARGYMPTPTYSLHWIADPGFRHAVARYLDEERAHAIEQRAMLAEYAPFRKVVAPEDA